MDKEVKIYFKVDGVEQYITSLDQLEEALKGVDGATTEATQATKKLQEQAEDFDKLEKKLETTEGAIKTLAGSFEILAGAAGLLGVEDNEFFKSLEENVVSVIALAEGGKNVAEGLSLLAKNQKLATAAQKAFNLVANANPYVLLATAVITLTGAIAAYVTFMNDEAIPTEEELEQIRKRNTKATEDAERIEKQAQKAEEDRISTLEDLRTKLEEVADEETKKNKTTLDGAIMLNEQLLKEQQKALEFTDDLISAMELRTDATYDELQSLVDQGLNLTEEEQALYDLYQQRLEQEQKVKETTDLLNDAYEKRNEIIYEQNLIETEQIDRMDEMIDGYNRLAIAMVKTSVEAHKLQTNMRNVFPPAKEELDDFATEYYKAFNQFMEEPEVWRDLLIRDTQAAFGFINNIATIFTKDSEKRAERQFKINKALSLSNAIINTAAGVTDALAKDATFPGSRFISAAAVAASGAAQIATILRQKFEGGGSNLPDEGGLRNPVGALQYNFGQQAGEEIQPGQFSSSQQPEPIRAYVLVSDVNSAQQTNQQIENLARL